MDCVSHGSSFLLLAASAAATSLKTDGKRRLTLKKKVTQLSDGVSTAC